VLIGFLAASLARGGVTLITHGLNGNADGWITGMAQRIPLYDGFRGTNYTCYEAYFYQSGANWFLTASRVAGGPPQDPESGEIIVKLDWGPLANGNSFDTYQIASAAVPALLSTNFIPELGGHALAEFPLHLIGHSRGGSLVCEISRLLGTNGVWVDHLTTLDPHPLNNDGFNLDILLYSDVDAPARTYQTVLFHDNYWQDLSWPVYGETVAGSYSRELAEFSGGYSSAHSDAHLWYHGTIDWRVPAHDTEVSLSSSDRNSGWNAYEAAGAQAGYRYSRIGGGDRRSTDRPRGTGTPMIRNGYNQKWDLGAGISANRTSLATNNGSWPSLIQAHRTSTNAVTPGMSVDVDLFYQWSGVSTNGRVYFALDPDLNPQNGNEITLQNQQAPGTGLPGFIGGAQVNIALNPTNVFPGEFSLLTRIEASGRRRYLYSPQPIRIVAAPSLDITAIDPTMILIGLNGASGQSIVLESSPDLWQWTALSTNTLSADRLEIPLAVGEVVSQFFRARLAALP
jgi:hypothetical protein